MSQKTLTEGTYTALVTPFDEQFQIDEKAWFTLLDHQVAGKVDGVVICGTTGESPSINAAEFDFLIRSARNHLGSSFKIWAGTGTNVTESTIKRSKRAAELGADGLLLVTPYYNKPTQQGLQNHFTEVADSVDLPVMLYNVPGRTSTLIQPETTEALSKHPNIIASKEATGNINQIMEVISRVPDEFAVISGDDAMTLPIIAAGGKGVVSVIANLVPGLMRELVENAKSEDLEAARKVHNKLWPLMKASFFESNPIPIKATLEMAGLIQPYLRPPMYPLSDSYKPELKQILDDLNITD